MYRPMFDRQKRIPSLIMAIYLLFVLIGIISKVSLAQDLCKTCKPFPDEDRRDQLYKLGALEYPISDAYIDEETWYCSRMDLAKTAPGISQCGTLFPIWAKEELVDDNEIFNVTVCAQIPGHTCHESFVIKAKLCGMYKSYNLKQTAADAAYCLGSLAKPSRPFCTRKDDNCFTKAPSSEDSITRNLGQAREETTFDFFKVDIVVDCSSSF
ncbi:uncharacterized protein LOC121368908 [Gigantopelta aegis]|uniref:uncharacterized protein LOC121368908 n=1 Tax=Gigantopelta aegis TaxID=1735272 RepID=UPI001B88B0AC|nr:uncharacterized protein LOC121368908 [Gigantopelta aegis]